MKKWRIWLRRTAWLAMGLVLMSGSAGISALAAEISETGTPQESVESGEAQGAEASNGGRTFFIVDFEDLEQGVQNQELEAGETPYLPDTLAVTAAVGEKSGDTAAAGQGISGVVQSVTEVSRLPRVEKTLSQVGWEIATTSTSNNYTTYTYVPVIPETDENGNHVEVVSVMAPLPTIQAVMAGVQEEGEDEFMPLADNDPPTLPDNINESWRNEAYGVTVIGPDNTVVWTEQSGRITIKQPGTYYIQGVLDAQKVLDDKKSSSDPFITLEKAGDYQIVLLRTEAKPLKIDLSELSYTRFLKIPAGANVQMSGWAELYCRPQDSAQYVLENNGTLEVMGKSEITCTGRFNNNKKITVRDMSTITTGDTFDNNGDLVIEESSVMKTGAFTNNGTVEIKGELRNGGSGRTYSYLETKGMLWNKSGKKVTIDEGWLKVTEGDEKEDFTKDWKIDNDGIMEIKNKGKAEAKEVLNNGGAQLTVKGENTVLIAYPEGSLTTGGELTVDEMGKVEAGTLVNSGELELGSSAEDGKQGFLEITKSSANSENTGTIVIEAGSKLYKSSTIGTVTLTNNGSLTIKAEDALGTGDEEVSLAGEGAFIFAGLYPDVLHLPDPYEIAYTGESQTQDVMGPAPYTVDSTLVTEDPENPDDPQPVNKGGGVVTIDSERKNFHGVDFEVKVKAKLEKIMLTRPERPEDSSNGWAPGVEAVVDTGDGTDTANTADVTTKGIFEPGDYELIYVNTEVPGQTASVKFTMTEWSMILDTNQGPDDVVKEEHPDDASGYAVYENKKDITCTVKVAIFNAKNAKGGKVTLYWNAFDAKATDQPMFANSGAKGINLDENGKGSVTITIPTESEDYILPPQLDPDKANWETDAYTYDHPYRLTAVYEQKVEGTTDNYNWYHTSGADTSEAHKDLITDHPDGTLEGWYADKKVIVVRQKPNLQFTSSYYTNVEGLLTYNGEPLRMPEAQKDITYRSNQDSPEYEWYKGLESQVIAAYESQSVNVSGLQKWEPSSEEKDEEGNPALAPKDAGWYIIKATVPATRDFIGETRLHYIHVEPKNLTISVKDQHKPYGAKDPDEWVGFPISNDVNETSSDLYVVEGLLAVDNGKMKGEITRVDDNGEECGRYEIKITAWAEDGDPTRDNYKLDMRKGIGTLTIDQRELEWDTDKLFLVITDDDTVSVVGGLKTGYRLEDGEDKADVEAKLKDDDVVVVYDKLDLSADKGKITIDKLRLGGADKDNYVIQSKSFTVPANSTYKVSVKAGTIDSTTMTKLKEYGTAYNTEDQVIKAMESQLEGQGVKRTNTAVYDIILTKANGDALTEQEIEDFPWGALTVTVPYPAGTSRATSFMAAHMITEKTNLEGPNKNPGNVETRTWNQVATVEDGVRFQLESLSPVAIGWSATTNPNNPNGGDDSNNGTNGGDGSGTNNGTNNGTNGGTNNGTSNGTNNGTNNGTATGSNTKTTNNKTATGSNTRTTGVLTGDPAQIAFYSIATLIACLLLILIIFLIRVQFRKKD